MNYKGNFYVISITWKIIIFISSSLCQVLSKFLFAMHESRQAMVANPRRNTRYIHLYFQCVAVISSVRGQSAALQQRPLSYLLSHICFHRFSGLLLWDLWKHNPTTAILQTTAKNNLQSVTLSLVPNPAFLLVCSGMGAWNYSGTSLTVTCQYFQHEKILCWASLHTCCIS